MKYNTGPCIALDSCNNLSDILETMERTTPEAVAYKANPAFIKYDIIWRLPDLIKENNLLILDGKFNDIPYAMEGYAAHVLNSGFKSVTVNPIFGSESIIPFLKRGIFTFVLIKGSNTAFCGNVSNHLKILNDLVDIYPNQIGAVVGATKPATVNKVRKVAGDIPILTPGIGAQGGNLDEVKKAAGRNGSLLWVVGRESD